MKTLPFLSFLLLGTIGAAVYVLEQDPLPAVGIGSVALKPSPGVSDPAPLSVASLAEAKAEARVLRPASADENPTTSAWTPSTRGLERKISLSLPLARPASQSTPEAAIAGDSVLKTSGRPAQEVNSVVPAAGAKPEYAATRAASVIQLGLNIPGAAGAVSAHNPAALPVVFQEPSPELAANPQAADTVAQLRQKFVDAIGGPDQNPRDPAYLQRWVTAQKMIDDKFRVTFGAQAFLAAQLTANAHGQ